MPINIPIISSGGATSTVSVPDPVVGTVTGTRIFNGDYSTGNFSQWPVVQNVTYNSSGSGYPATGRYQAAIINDSTYGKAARFEVRSGDSPFLGTERSEVQAGGNTGGSSGTTRWYRFATKFDATFPTNHASLGWGLTNQFHGNFSGGSPWVAFHVGRANGMWSLSMNRQGNPGTYLGEVTIWQVPLGIVWHDIKMQIKWSTGSDGFIKLWYNGVPQTFMVGGSTTYTGQNMITGDSGSYYKEGYYRQATSPTGIVYHTGFRCATSESAL